MGVRARLMRRVLCALVDMVEKTDMIPVRCNVLTAGRGRPGRCSFAGPGAFTLVELMVVISILALLMAILLPYFGRVFEVARNTRCQNNLEKIAQALHTSGNQNVGAGSGGAMAIPTGASWYNKVLAITSNSEEVVRCLSDERDMDALGNINLALDSILKDVYILQYHTTSTTQHDISFIPDIMAGKPVPDPQIWVIYPAGNRYDKQRITSGEPDITVPPLTQNDLFIGIDNDAAVKLTFSETYVTITPYADTYQRTMSRHWVMKGAGTPICPLPGGKEPEDSDDKILCHLWGWHVTKLDGPVIIPFGAPASYGINSLLQPRNWRPSEFYIMDANDVVVDLHTYELDQVRDRHLRRAKDGTVKGMVNVVNVDGTVRGWTLEEMERELDKDLPNRWEH